MKLDAVTRRPGDTETSHHVSASAFVLHPSSLHSGAEGEIRTLETNLEDSHVSSYITPAKAFPIADCRMPIVRTSSTDHADHADLRSKQVKVKLGVYD